MSYDRIQNKLDEHMRKIYNGAVPKIYGQTYWYVLGFTKTNNKKVFWGPFLEKEDAYKDLAKLQEGESFELRTRDPHRAVRAVRDILIARGESPDETLKKLLHKREEPKPQGFLSKLTQGRLSPKPKSSLLSSIPLPKRRKVSRASKEDEE